LSTDDRYSGIPAKYLVRKKWIGVKQEMEFENLKKTGKWVIALLKRAERDYPRD
jgi:hypothetical protein